MPSVNPQVNLGCPPIRALTFDSLGLIKVTETRGQCRGIPTVVNTWGEMNASWSVLATSIDDRFSSPLLAVARKYGSGNENNAKKVDLMGHSLHPFLAWEQLKKTLQSKKNKAPSMRTCVEEIVFTFTYPRIDLAVSKQMNHLLKAPFCVHPETGRVCVLIDPDNCDEFDPLAVPTLSQLIEEFNSGGMDVDDDDRSLLGKSIKFFRSSFLGPLLKSCKEEIETSYRLGSVCNVKASLSFILSAGEFLALTGGRLNGKELVAIGMATHFVSSSVSF